MQTANLDGTPFNDSQKSSAVSAVSSSMSDVKNSMQAQSNGNSICNSALSEIPGQMKSLSNDPFVLDKNNKSLKLNQSLNHFRSLKSYTLQTAKSLQDTYSSLSMDYRDLTKPNLGTIIAKSAITQSQAQSKSASIANFNYSLSTDPNFRASVSASQSTSASLADLPQSTRTSILNSLANKNRGRLQ